MTSPSTAPHRLAVFLPSLEGGGAEGVLTAILNGLAARAVCIELYLAKASGIHLERLDRQIRIHDLKAGSVMRAIPRLTLALQRSRPDTLLSAMSHANVAAWIATRLAGQFRPRLVLSERMSLQAREKFYNSLPERTIRALMPRMIAQADAVIVPVASMIPAFMAHCRVDLTKFRAIPNPIPNVRDQSTIRRWPLGERFRSAGHRIVLAVGRLSAVKDYPTLIRAFAALPQVHDAQLVILGEGEERPALTSLIGELGVGERVSLPGYCVDPIAAMADCDVYVLSSRFEGLPNALLEALSVGATVVSTDCPTGPRELLDGGRLGTLVPVGSVTAMTRALDDALSNKTVRAPADLSGYSLDRIVEEYAATLFPQEGA